MSHHPLAATVCIKLLPYWLQKLTRLHFKPVSKWLSTEAVQIDNVRTFSIDSAPYNNVELMLTFYVYTDCLFVLILPQGEVFSLKTTNTPSSMLTV